jgi:protein TonB
MAAAGPGANGGSSGARGPASEKRVKAAAPKPSDAADGCVEEPTKPKAIEKAQPQYVDEARAANIEGVVKVEFRVGADGEVIDAKVLQGLGHGLDQAALAAAKRWKFSPAMRCGKPVESRHVVSMRFQLGD